MFRTIVCKKNYITLIKKQSQGPKRFQKQDKWVKSLNHQHIKTYVDYVHNQLTQKYKIKETYTEHEENQDNRLQSNDRQNLAILSNLTPFKKRRIDDNQLTQDISKITIKDFIKDCMKFQKQQHRLFVIFLFSTIISLFFYFKFMYNKQFVLQEMNRPTNPQFLEQYHIKKAQKLILDLETSIEVVLAEYHLRLKQSANY